MPCKQDISSVVAEFYAPSHPTIFIIIFVVLRSMQVTLQAVSVYIEIDQITEL